jgi:hypothetical protein
MANVSKIKFLRYPKFCIFFFLKMDCPNTLILPSVLIICFRHVDISDCGQYLIVCPQEDCRDNLVYFADLNKLSKDSGISGRLDLTQVVYKFSHDYEVCKSQILTPKPFNNYGLFLWKMFIPRFIMTFLS